MLYSPQVLGMYDLYPSCRICTIISCSPGPGGRASSEEDQSAILPSTLQQSAHRPHFVSCLFDELSGCCQLSFRVSHCVHCVWRDCAPASQSSLSRATPHAEDRTDPTMRGWQSLVLCQLPISSFLPPHGTGNGSAFVNR